MSDEGKKPDLKLLKFATPSCGGSEGDNKDVPASNEQAARALRNKADQLMEIDLEVGSVGIAVAFQNGVTLSSWIGTYPILLVGALALLQKKVLEEEGS